MFYFAYVNAHAAVNARTPGADKDADVVRRPFWIYKYFKFFLEKINFVSLELVFVYGKAKIPYVILIILVFTNTNTM